MQAGKEWEEEEMEEEEEEEEEEEGGWHCKQLFAKMLSLTHSSTHSLMYTLTWMWKSATPKTMA